MPPHPYIKQKCSAIKWWQCSTWNSQESASISRTLLKAILEIGGGALGSVMSSLHEVGKSISCFSQSWPSAHMNVLRKGKWKKEGYDAGKHSEPLWKSKVWSLARTNCVISEIVGYYVAPSFPNSTTLLQKTITTGSSYRKPAFLIRGLLQMGALERGEINRAELKLTFCKASLSLRVILSTITSTVISRSHTSFVKRRVIDYRNDMLPFLLNVCLWQLNTMARAQTCKTPAIASLAPRSSYSHHFAFSLKPYKPDVCLGKPAFLLDCVVMHIQGIGFFSNFRIWLACSKPKPSESSDTPIILQ